MAITVTLEQVLKDRDMSLTELSDRVGVTLANLSILKTGKAKAVRFSTLSALCEVLQCQPGDILAFEDEAETVALDEAGPAAAHHLERTEPARA